jgi:deoxycytidylate deaminase
VFRYHKGTHELANSRPCKRCIKIMKKNRIKNVYYSTNKGDIVKEKVESMDIKSAHVSSGIKKYMSNKHINK